MSLGGKRYAKNASSGAKSSIVSSLERRWSFMVAGTGNRQNQKQTLNTIEDVTFTSTTSQEADSTNVEKDNSWDAQITKSEYEEIKDRVAAIETRISKEFTNLQSTSSNNSLDSVDMLDDIRNGPERVLEKFERTVEETEMMNTSPMTEQLAKHLSRGLKIRSNGEAKVFRSPSARKIGSIRRRSQENVRLTRNKTWHLGSNITNSSPRANKIPSPRKIARVTRNSPLKPIMILNTPNMEKNIQIPRVNLKRGKPNTFPNGIRPMQQIDNNKQNDNNHHSNGNSTFIISHNTNDDSKRNDNNIDLQNENWICADVFFDTHKTPNQTDDSVLNSSKSSANKMSATRVKPARKRLNNNTSIDVTPTTTTKMQSQPNQTVNNDTMKTPMLPPRLPLVKKTPAKTPHQSLTTNRNNFTPLLQQEQTQIAGRASIARLRNQNAGMVMAKAKLFDKLVTDEPCSKQPKPMQTKTDSRRSTLSNRNEQQEMKFDVETSIRTRLNQALNKEIDSPRRNKASSFSSNGVQRRQQLRAQRHTPTKKTPIALDKNLVTLTEANNRIRRNASSPATSMHDLSIQSPMTRRMASIDATPHAKRITQITKPPRRIIRTPQKRKPF